VPIEALGPKFDVAMVGEVGVAWWTITRTSNCVPVDIKDAPERMRMDVCV